MAHEGRLRIGELSRRVGVSPELLRAWETRYRLVEPERTAGGLRLYSAEDEARVRAMRSHMDRGLSAAEAARLVKATPGADDEPTASAPPDQLARDLRAALDRFDDVAAQAVLDRLFGNHSIESAISDVLMPYMRELGERWERAEANVAQEHFASNVIEGRLRTLARGWDQGSGRRAVLACPSGELHDLPLLCFGLALRGHGWRITYLGADTPIAQVRHAVEAASPDVVVMAAVWADRFAAIADELSALAREVPLAIAGAGASATLAERLGARMLADEPVAAAAVLDG